MTSFKLKMINSWREDVFFYTMVLLAGVLPFSEALVSISSGLLLFQAIILSSWKHPSVKQRTPKSLLFMMSIFMVYVIGFIFTLDFSFAIYELKKVIFWIIIPLGVYLSPRLNDKQINSILKIFIAAVTVASIIFAVKIIFTHQTQIAEFRTISIISHIRYSLQIVLAIVLLGWFLVSRKTWNAWFEKVVYFILLLWLVYFLFLLKSLLGIISFLATAFVAFIFIIRKMESKQWRILLTVSFILFISIPSFFIGKIVFDFYNFKKFDRATVDKQTPSGNLYQHDFDNLLRENGNLVFVYICDDELRQEWNKRSDIKYDANLNGYPLSNTLVRYLASRGLRKDSTGVSQLTDAEVELIKNGVTNYKFKNAAFSIYPRIYETIWELENYSKTGDPNNKTLAQRIEFVKASLVIIKENFWFGIGTGNWVIKYNEVYDKMNSKLLKEKRGPSHNQYLNYMVKFGIVGFLWILVALLAPVFIEGQQRNYVFILFFVAIAAANFGDANLETHMGLPFFVLFYSLFLWNSTATMNYQAKKG